ncbi:acylneuraminate cytidylyltransferase family protein [Oryzomonas sagensis]|uniref:Acylneuraminate cytidylyltransferase family protein n=1 Tax=Oryzomonas sagensis TaxID=2603857 RepID=A0ABQ6TKI3_9BACT|nr:acylneuraminate cytidylyltransferase family protein [Oryzomonas sagensis]KAB0668527.1 acylneuraminate cytidylyltransferase family protein [Oryzomonas sagensis]
MIQGKRVLAVIPARGGSKSIPRKNITPLAGKPLLCWTVEVAQQVGEIDRIIVSTDDDEIGRVAGESGAEVYSRPSRLAADDALVIDTLRYLIEALRNEGESADIVMLLEPTSPLRSADDIRQCLALLQDSAIDSVATFKEAELNPCRAWRIENGQPDVFIPGVNPWLPRQKLPRAYQLNGAVYAFRADGLTADVPSILFGNSAAVVMPAERSVDIDGWNDVFLAEAILAGRGVQ